MKKITKQKLTFWLITTLVVSLIFGYAIKNQWFYSWHLKFSNFLYFETGNRTINDIVIVAIDNKSFAIKNASELGTLQFSKADYAQAFDNIEKAGASVIGVDIIFSEISSIKDQAKLIRTLKENNNIILAAEPNGLKPLDVFIEPRPENVASILFRPDSDNTVRRQQILFDDEQAKEAFAVKILKKHMNLLPKDSQKVEGGYQIMNFPVRVGGKKISPIRLPLDERNNLIVNFFGAPNSFKSISFIDAFKGNMISRKNGNPIDLTGKIVLVGEMGTGIHDVQYVPTSFGTPMPGIEIHANLIQTILQQKFLQNQSPLSLQLTIVGIIVIGLLIFLFLRLSISIAILIMGFIAYIFGTYFAFELGTILNTIYPYLALFIVFLTAYIFRYFLEAKGAKKTQKAFGKYVSPEVVKKIIENPDALELGGNKKTLTVFFSDIVGFTSIAEKTKPEALVKSLNNYLDAMGDIILQSGGTLDKFIGDAIVAFWNAPIPVKNHAVKACYAALEAQEAAAEVNPKWKTRMGINTGEVIVGNMGSNKRFDYTAIGDNMNLGARLESANKFYGTKILISESTYRATKSQIEAREIDLIKVKGKTKPVRIYELQAKKGRLKKAQKELNVKFKKGLDAYRKQNWKTAESAFIACKSDPPAKAYLARIKELKATKLPAKWSGVYKMKTK